MTHVLTELLECLSLERLSENLFRAHSQDLSLGQVFGGQILGQALSAATQTIERKLAAHSLHACFLRSLDVHQPVLYRVERLRDSNRFSTRRVTTIQNEQQCSVLTASYGGNGTGLEHADPMPSVPDPDSLVPDFEMWRQRSHLLPESLRPFLNRQLPIELRSVDPIDPFAPVKRPPVHAIWMRAADVLPDDEALHRCLLAYASDFDFALTALRPHGVSILDPSNRVVSLDHAMWFHRPFRMDEWVLHVMQSPVASSARCLVRGNFFTRDGRLIASSSQEGFFRNRVPSE